MSRAHRQVNFRIPEALVAQLKSVAISSRRTLTAELIHRLERSLGSVTVTCVYCGRAYPDQTPTAGAEILKQHIAVCDAHPLRAAEATIEKLRGALCDMVGAHDVARLREMFEVSRVTMPPGKDRDVCLAAIRVAIETAP